LSTFLLNYKKIMQKSVLLYQDGGKQKNRGQSYNDLGFFFIRGKSQTVDFDCFPNFCALWENDIGLHIRRDILLHQREIVGVIQIDVILAFMCFVIRLIHFNGLPIGCTG